MRAASGGAAGARLRVGTQTRAEAATCAAVPCKQATRPTAAGSKQRLAGQDADIGTPAKPACPMMSLQAEVQDSNQTMLSN